MLNEKKSGRKLIVTNRKITNNPQKDIPIISKILEESISVHKTNVAEMENLFKIYFNDDSYWQKQKMQRPDIDNKITIDDAWAISRTINGYCFGEPIKYVSSKPKDNIQTKIEEFSDFLDFQHNHDATLMATLCSSICGLGYKLVLPATKEEYDSTGIPFIINPNVIDPTNAFVVYSSDIMHKPVIGVVIGDHYNEKGEKDGNEYTVWTNKHQYIFIENKSTSGYKPIEIDNENGEPTIAKPIFSTRIPLIEIERNAFRKGDWEVATDLLTLKNNLLSDRADDIKQVVDYVLVLLNCQFAEGTDQNTILKNRVLSMTVKDPTNPPKVDMLKNPLDQTGVQIMSDYIDSLIDSVVGIPTRAERGGGGHDTGQAVIYRNGFRDLENNAAMIIPKMDKAEREFLTACLGYCNNITTCSIKGLKSVDVRCKFVRSMSDDVMTTSTAYATFRGAGMNDLDALIASHAVTDPSEVHKNNLKESVKDDGETAQKPLQQEKTQKSVDNSETEVVS